MSIPEQLALAPLQEISPDMGDRHSPEHTVPAAALALGGRLPTRKGVIALGVFSLLALVYWIYQGGTPTPADTQLIRVETVARPISKQLELTGVLGPKEQYTVTAPFAGLVLAKQVSLGQRVNTGDVLARIGTRDIEIQLRDAETVLIKARQQLATLVDWENGPEVHKARWDLDKSQRHLETLSQRVEQSKKLLDIGIIPATEYENEVQQLQDQRMDLAAAREALDTTLKQGDAMAREIATLELENAEIKVKRLQESIAEAVIKAPIDGVVVAAKPSADASDGKDGEINFTVGDKLKEGQPLFSISNIKELIVQSKISEIDINAVDVGQEATVFSGSLPGVTMIGHVTKIAYQARAGSMNSSPFPSFDIELTLNAVPPEHLQRLHLGVTVEVSMEIYHRDSAIVVPFDAVEEGATGPFVRIVAEDGTLQQQPVQLGASLVDGMEVLSGVQAGDVLAFTEIARDDDSL